MSGIPIASVKDPNGLVIFGRKAPKEADEPNLVIDLTQSKQSTGNLQEWQSTLSSGLEDIIVEVANYSQQIKVKRFDARVT